MSDRSDPGSNRQEQRQTETGPLGDEEATLASSAHAQERQLVFDFPNPRHEASSFLVTEANRDACRLVSAPQLWAPAACVAGPRGSGKTHLAADYFGDARVFSSEALGGDAAEAAGGLGVATERLLELVGAEGVRVVLDNVDNAFGGPFGEAAERAMFHIFNRAAERGAKILLLSRTPPARWPVELPDLRTRLRTVPVARIEGPDDALIAHLLRKRFSDLGFVVDDGTVQYMVTRLPRSFEAVEEAVRKVNSRAWADNQTLSIPFVRSALGF